MRLLFQQIIFILIFIAILPVGFCIKCFQCNSAENPQCAEIQIYDTFSPFLHECNGHYDGKQPFCRKTITKIVENNEDRIIRSCGWVIDQTMNGTNHCKNKDTDFIWKKSCSCFSSMCNSSPSNNNKNMQTIFILFQLAFWWAVLINLDVITISL